MPKSTSNTALITQPKLRRYLQLREAVEEFKMLEQELFHLVKDGAERQPGPLMARIKTTPGKRYPKWRECFVTLADQHYGSGEGEKKAQEVTACTAPNKDSEKLEVIDTRETVV